MVEKDTSAPHPANLEGRGRAKQWGHLSRASTKNPARELNFVHHYQSDDLRVMRAAFASNGFIVADLDVPTHELHWLREVLNILVARGAGESRAVVQDLVPPDVCESEHLLVQVLEPEAVISGIASTVIHRSARSIAARLLGCDAHDLRFFGHMVMMRGPETPWHQDVAYWEPGSAYRALTVWVPLADASVESGCLQFIPGSHLEPLRAHRRIGDDPGILIEAFGVDATTAVACPVAAGVATIHDSRMLHYSGPNRTDSDRAAFIQTFLF
jgi:hypothetical protein